MSIWIKKDISAIKIICKRLKKIKTRSVPQTHTNNGNHSFTHRKNENIPLFILLSYTEQLTTTHNMDKSHEHIGVFCFFCGVGGEGWLKQQTSVLELASLRSGCQHGQVLCEGLPSGLQTTIFSLYPHMVENRERYLLDSMYITFKKWAQLILGC